MKKLNKIVCSLLSVLLLLSLMASCGKKVPDVNQTEVLEAANTLLERAQVLNKIWFEEAVTFLDDGFSTGAYLEIDMNSLTQFGFHSIEDVQNETKNVYTRSAYQLIDSLTQNPIKSEELSRVAVSRYIVYQNTVNKEDENNGKILKYHLELEKWSDQIDIQLNTIAFKAAKYGPDDEVIATVTANVHVTNAEGKTQTRPHLTFDLVFEDETWKLDTPVFIVFDDRMN